MGWRGRPLSIEPLQLRPYLLQVSRLQPAGEEDVKILIAARVRVGQAAHVIDMLEMRVLAFRVAVQDDHDVAGIVARAPNPIIVLPADGPRQSIPGAIEIDGRGLAPEIGEDRGPRLLFWRQAVVHARHLLDHLRPPKLVGKILRQRAVVLVLSLWRLEADPFLITDKAFR